jgi:hypothetical protein
MPCLVWAHAMIPRSYSRYLALQLNFNVGGNSADRENGLDTTADDPHKRAGLLIRFYLDLQIRGSILNVL